MELMPKCLFVSRIPHSAATANIEMSRKSRRSRNNAWEFVVYLLLSIDINAALGMKAKKGPGTLPTTAKDIWIIDRLYRRMQPHFQYTFSFFNCDWTIDFSLMMPHEVRGALRSCVGA